MIDQIRETGVTVNEKEETGAIFDLFHSLVDYP
jgi:hypothetical protein